MEDQSRITKELEEKRKQAEEAQLRLKLEREEAEKEHERMMERVRYEQEEKDKIVRDDFLFFFPTFLFSIASLFFYSYLGILNKAHS